MAIITLPVTALAPCRSVAVPARSRTGL